MWIMLNDAFVSIVKDERNKKNLMVRARMEGDVQRAMRDGSIVEGETPDADYRFRASLPRKKVADAIAANVTRINYPNFKNTVKRKDRGNAYLRVWGDLSRWQDEVYGPPDTKPLPLSLCARAEDGQ